MTTEELAHMLYECLELLHPSQGVWFSGGEKERFAIDRIMDIARAHLYAPAPNVSEGRKIIVDTIEE